MIGPGKCQGKLAEHFGDALGIDEMGVLEVEAPRFQAAKQGPNFPAAGIGGDGLVLRRTGRSDDQQFTVFETQGRQVNETAPDRSTPWQMVNLVGGQGTKQAIAPHQLVPGIADQGVTFDA